ncbi:PLP-dependent aminotransferase family protein [Propylenella binzhouense]|nr:PLP-dependent aminotransferase family protein [Propylenella binzhouense]
MADWIPKIAAEGGPRYLEIVRALESDIETGAILPGQRLLPHREMAERMGISVGTISRAYAEAQKRGLISGEVGRGTFVLRRRGQQAETEETSGFRRINLALNAPPATGEEDAIGGVLSDILASDRLGAFLGYLPHQGCAEHRAIMADRLTRQGMPTTPDCLFITHGAQHAISIATSLLARSGDPVLAENLTYSGMLALATQAGYELRGVLMDGGGLVPEDLERAFRQTGARVLYAMPTLQTPTSAVMPAERRDAIAEIIARHDAYLIEDDAYGFLADPPLAPISARIPERSFYVVSFAKCLAPGLRIGAMYAPSPFRDRAINAVRATGWSANALMAEVVARLVTNGQLEEQVARKRKIAAQRYAAARRILGDRIAPVAGDPAFHVWLPMPAGRTTTSLVAQAAMANVTIAPPVALRSFDPLSNGVRLCLGSPKNQSELEYALRTVSDILNDAEAMSLV